MKIYSIAILVVSLLSGCGTLMQSLTAQKTVELVPTQVTQGRGEMVSVPAQLRTIIIKYEPDTATYRTCAEPAPDAALSDTFKLLAAAKAQMVDANTELQTSSAALELAGRTQVVLLAREFLFRVCESRSNGDYDRKEVKEQHDQIIKQITKMIETDRKKAEIKAAIVAEKFDPILLKGAAEEVNDAVTNACTKEFKGCLNEAPSENKQVECEVQFKTCLKGWGL